MGKLTKKDRIKMLEWQVKTLIQSMTNIEEWSSCADNMLTGLNHALPDPEYDAKCEAQEVDIDASLDRHRERLGLNKPQLKQLDQSIFDGLDEKWRFAAVDSDTSAYIYEARQHIEDNRYWFGDFGLQKYIGEGYDASDWQNSLIEREIAKEPLEVNLSSELTGSDLCRAMLARGDKFVMCFVHEFGDDRAVEDEASVAINFFNECGFQTDSNQYNNAVPINNQGEPLSCKMIDSEQAAFIKSQQEINSRAISAQGQQNNQGVYNQPPQGKQQFNNNMTSNGHGGSSAPLDYDIPFAPFYGGE